MKLDISHPRWFEWRERACQYLETDIADWNLAQDLALEDLGLKDGDDDKHDASVDNWCGNDWRYPKGEGAIVRNMLRGEDKMNVDELMPSKWLKASDLKGRNHEVVIGAVDVEEIGQQKERKPVMYFIGKQKALVLNKTKLKALAALHGKETDGWVGKAISIGPGKTMFQGAIIDCINISASTNKAVPVQPAPPPDEHDIEDDMDDEIPF